jgi:tetratricopeptide (TPR) repeat protein/transcriptional regulator with XRE-family HTH domain
MSLGEQRSDGATGDPGFGALLRTYRERGLLSQEQLAVRSGVSARAIGDLERQVRRPRGQSVRLLADALGLAGCERERFEVVARSSPLAGQRAGEPVPYSPGPAAPHQLPLDIADFVGRTELVAELRGWLDPGPDQAAGQIPAAGLAICAVSGQAGIGKSALAVHVAHQSAAQFPDGQLYANLRGARVGDTSPLDPGEVLGRFLRALGVDASAVPSGAEERAALYRSRLAGKRVLVMLDDAASERQVRPLLPGSSRCAVLLTSRTRLAGLEGARLLHVDVLDTRSALELLRRIVGGERVAAEADAAAAIVAACSRLPLAVRIAGARLAGRPHWPLGRMAALLADEHDRLKALAHGDLNVRASLSLSYQGLPPLQQRLFRRLGLLDAQEVTAWMAQPLLDCSLAQTEALLDDLADAQMVDAASQDVPGQTRYRLHDLTRAYARERVLTDEPAGERRAALDRALSGWLALAEQADRRLPAGSLVGKGSPPATRQPERAEAEDLLAEPLAWLEAEHEVLLSAIRQASAPDPAAVGTLAGGQLAETAWRLARAVTGFFWLHGCRDDYQGACNHALTAARRTGNLRGEAWMLSALAWVAIDQLRLDDAKALAGQARLIHQQVGDRRGEAYASLKVAHAHEHCGNLGDAADELKQVWELYEELDDDHGRGWVQHTLGRLRRKQGRLIEATADLEHALTISRRSGDRRIEVTALQELALVHDSLGQPGRAAALLLQSLRRCREYVDKLGEGWALQELGEMRLRQGAWVQAAGALYHALDIFRQLGARRTEASVLRTLGELHRTQGRLLEARVCLEEAVVIQRQLGLVTRLAQTLTELARIQPAAAARQA